jgi:hypothetical protein
MWEWDLCGRHAVLEITTNNLKFAMRLWGYEQLCSAPYLTQVLLMHKHQGPNGLGTEASMMKGDGVTATREYALNGDC